MKIRIRLGLYGFVGAIALTGIVGCSRSDTVAKDAGSQLTASDLSRLMDFHAWKVPVPQSQQPFKSIQLVIIKPDGTEVMKFSTGNNLGSEPCSFILLGFRVEQETFTGHFNTQDSKGGGTGWNLNFADKFADSWPAWVIESPVWNGNRAELASATKGDMSSSILAIELVK
jgi:hypothetical protein